MSNRNRKTKPSPPPPALDVNAVRSILSQRNALAGYLGQSFSGDRDMYTVLGYTKDDPEFNDYMAIYERQDIAGTIVDFPAEETWRDAPLVLDGDDTDGRVDTPFETAWSEMAARLNIWQRCEQADKLAGIGRYSVLLIGAADSGELSQELTRVRDGAAIIYLRSYSEDNAEVATLEKDTKSSRFGMPLTYSVRMGEGSPAQPVHWTRIIHVAENALENDIYGRPRLKRVWNRLMDLEKIVGGSAEATWLLIRKGFVLNIDKDIMVDQSVLDAMEEQIDEYIHGQRRILKTKGVTPSDLGTDVVDPSGLFDVLMSLISATTGIPKRILMGSERGELASTQDSASWAGRIGRRRDRFAGPEVINPLIDRFVSVGALPAPTSGEYSLQWKPLFELTEMEEAAKANTWADAFLKVMQQIQMAVAAGVQPVVAVEEFREQFTKLPVAPTGMVLPSPATLGAVAAVIGNQADPYSADEALAMITAAARIVGRG